MASIPLESKSTHSLSVSPYRVSSGDLFPEVDLMDDGGSLAPQDTALRGIGAGRWYGIACAPALGILARASALASMP